MIVERNRKYQNHLKIDEIIFKTKSGILGKREILNREDAVAALLYDTLKEKYILVSQFRAGAESEVLEIVAGTLDKEGEEPIDAIIREIEEEAGYKTDTITLLSECFLSPGASTEVHYIYFCEVSQKIGPGGGAAGELEEIDVIEMTRDELISTRFRDAKTIIAVNWARWNHKVETNEIQLKSQQIEI